MINKEGTPEEQFNYLISLNCTRSQAIKLRALKKQYPILRKEELEQTFEDEKKDKDSGKEFIV